MYKFFKIISFSFLTMFLSACSMQQQSIPEKNNKEMMTLGVIQGSIKKGMSKTDVLTTLGSPNMVSNDGDKETWVYDKISTETSEKSVSGSLIAAGIGGSFFGAGNASGSNKRSITSQKTLTVILKFNEKNNLEKISYHTSRF